MRKSHKRRPEPILVPQFRANHRIRATQVRLIDENGEMVGVVDLTEALRRAEEAELDLVEVSPKAAPPVCKIMSFGSFKYKKEKEAKAQKQKQKVVEMKGIRLSLRIGAHDLEVRATQAKKFLDNNNKVKIEMILKGRERQYSDQAREVMQSFIRQLGEVKIEQPFTKQGGKLSMIVAPGK
ncbi:translation initiation factor IF-3 [Candidatus Falkowbacteria bacterium]|nr:translation initiation factor IF-3 [Candidatus Falkowbacteria bacterium]